MRKQTFMKSILCLLMALVCNVAWAEVVLPTVSTPESGVMHYYRIKNYRSNKYAVYKGDAARLAQTTEFTYNTVWYVTADGTNYKLHNIATKKLYAGVSSFTDNGATVYIKENPHKAGYVCVSTTENLSSNCWDDQGNQTSIGNYNPRSGDADGTSWTFEEVTPISTPYSFTLKETTIEKTYTGSYTCYEGNGAKSLPACATIVGAEYSNVVWGENSVSADFAFSIPVETDIAIYPFKNDAIRYYVDGSNVKATKAIPTLGEGGNYRNYMWNICPVVSGDKFLFKLKNVGTNKFVYATKTNNANHGEGDVIVSSEDVTYFTMDSENRFVSDTPDGVRYLSIGSEAPPGYACLYHTTHGGTRNAFQMVRNVTGYRFTDSTGKIYVGSYNGMSGLVEPVLTGAYGHTFSNKVWNGETFEANINFPFPISKEGGVTNATYIANWIKSQVTPKMWKAVIEDGVFNVKVYNPDVTQPVLSELNMWKWAIYPQFTDGAFSFLIKNIHAGKYIYADPTKDYNATSVKGHITLQESGTAFEAVQNGNNVNFAYIANVDDVEKTLKLTTSSSGGNDVYLSSYTGSHEGNHIKCPTLSAYTVTTDANGYAAIYSPVPVTIPTGVAAYTGRLKNATNTLILSKVNTTIPAETAVIVKGTASTTFKFNVSSNVASITNDLKGSASNATVSDAYTFNSSNAKFSKVAGGEVAAYAAYLEVAGAADVISTFQTEDIAEIDGWLGYSLHLYGQRGFMYANNSNQPAAVNNADGNSGNDIAYNVVNDKHHFAVVKIGDKSYLYSIGVKKFLVKNGNNGVAFAALPKETVTFETSSNATYPWIAKLGGNMINISNGDGQTNGILIAGTSNPDEGARWAFSKTGMFALKNINGAEAVSAEWLNEECVDVATTAEIPQGIKNLSNYSTFVDEANYTQKLKTSGEHFYLSAGRLTGLFNWRSGSGTQRVNIVAIEVVGMDGTVVDADYHYGYAGKPSQNNTYSVDVPSDGLYYLRYYAETKTNGGINDSDIDITYTLMPNEVYIAADALQTDGTYLKHFLYNDDGTLRTSTRVSDDDKFKWTVEFLNNGNYTIANKAGKKLGYDHVNVKGLVIADDAIELSLSSANAVHAGSLGMQRIGEDSDGKYMVTKSDGSAFNRNGSKLNNGTWTSDYIFVSSALKAVTIVANVPQSGAVFTCGDYELASGTSILCNGITGELGLKSCKVTYTLEGFYSDAGYTNRITRVDEPVLNSDKTIYAKLIPNIFSTAYGDKWINLTRASNASHVAILTSSEANSVPVFNNLDYSNVGTLWSFVGDIKSFKIYNRLSGDGMALSWNDDTPADGEIVKMVAANEAISWHLIEYANGYAIAPVGNSEKGINSYTGNAGSQLKFYGVNDDGTHWNFNIIDVTKSLTLAVQVEGEQPYANNTRIAHLGLACAGNTATTIVKGNIAPLTYYFPLGATFSLSNSVSYRGYIFNGFVDANENVVEEYTDATLPEGGLNLTTSYSVDETNKYQYLFYNRDDVNDKPYRIPAIATASNNTVLAFSDYRPCSNDIGHGEVDIMLRRSYDNGETWSDAVCIADGQGGNDNVFNVGFGDAAVVADRESGKVLVMAVAGKQVFVSGSATGHNSMAKIVSNDNGESWNAPEDVTSQFMIDETSLFPKAYTMFFGSGRMLQSRVYKAEGADYYRIYGALLIKHPSDTYTGECNYVVYSDDFGATWKILGGSIEAGMCCNGGNEPKVEELPDGSIVLSSRKYNGRYFNVFTYTDKATGAGEWSTAVASNNQTGGISFGGNATNGEIYKVKAIRNSDKTICDVMLQSIPTGAGRSNVSIYFKEMSYAEAYTPTTFAENWTKGLEVSEMGSAYSTMILQADGNFGFFYEEEPGDQWAYCMVYVPLSLEELTKGAYSLYTVNSTIGEYKIGTFYASEAMQIPDGIKAYVATKAPEMKEGGVGVITMQELEGIIPAKTGAVLRGEADDYKFIPSISYGTPVANNMMVGYEAKTNDPTSKNQVVLTDEVKAQYATYFLTVKEGKAGFYAKYSNFNVANNKAYLQIPKVDQEVRAIYFDFDDNTTAIESAFEDEATGVIYDLQGRQLKKATSNGIYIVNGKKVLK